MASCVLGDRLETRRVGLSSRPTEAFGRAQNDNPGSTHHQGRGGGRALRARARAGAAAEVEHRGRGVFARGCAWAGMRGDERDLLAFFGRQEVGGGS